MTAADTPSPAVMPGALEARVVALEAALDEARRDLALERAPRRWPILESVVDMVEGDDEEAILANAERLSSLLERRK